MGPQTEKHLRGVGGSGGGGGSSDGCEIHQLQSTDGGSSW
jgi:hypothetical protein